MDRKTAGLCIVLVLALAASTAATADAPPVEPSPAPDAESALDTYRQHQLDLFDALRVDPAPRTQVLVGRLYIDDNATPSALRPKREDVTANAAQLARGDAFVQWVAADSGNYYSSQCGPTRWPEAEVAALVALEPGNAGALQYAAALAQAKGDQAGLDEALTRMASASHADDHLGDEVAQWREVYTARPAESGFAEVAWTDATPSERALFGALQQTASRSSPIESALQSACKPDGGLERAWQRLDSCISAGSLLASKGSSFALRETGLGMLTAAGATADDVADLQRQFDWLKANSANPMRNSSAFQDTPADLVADWQGAPGEIAATKHRLKRLGKPLTVPAGWTANAENATDNASTAAWLSYLRTVVEDLRGSSDARERAVGLAINVSAFEDQAKPSAETESGNADTALVDLAAAHPDDQLVQWTAALAAKAGAAKNEAAIVRVRQLEPDNAAAWTLALEESGSASTEILHHAAAATRFDEHAAAPVLSMYAAFKRHPMPAELRGRWGDEEFAKARDPDKVQAFAVAMSLAVANQSVAPSMNALRACRSANVKTDARIKADCVKLARLMLNSRSSLMAASVGETTLRSLDALGVADQERARQVAWWRSQSLAIDRDLEHYIDDYLAGSSELDAIEQLLVRAGKAEPPADWKSPVEKRTTKGQ